MNDNLFERIKQAYTNQASHNHTVELNIQELSKLLPQVEDHKQLLFRLKYWQGEQSLYFQNLIFITYFGLALLSLIPVFTIHIAFLILTFIFLVLGFSKIQFANPISDLEYQFKDFYIQSKYNLRYHQADGQNPVFPIESFPLFELGEHENTIKNKTYGQWDVQGQNFPFMLFNYYYVKSATKFNEKGSLETKKYSFNLYGIMLKNFPARGISISTNQKKKSRLGIEWTSGDINFDEHYQLSGFSEIWLAKFFKPANILHIENALRDYQGDFYIDPQTSTLCWLFEENIFQIENFEKNASTVADFAEHLETLRMANYERLSATLQRLITELQ